MNHTLDGYRAALTTVVFLDRSDRVRLDVTGPDRAKFLHNLTTNDIKRLPEGQGMEAFVTSPQGKTLGYVALLATDDRVIVRTDPGGVDHVLPHLRKYGIFDDVAIDDLTATTFEYHLAGSAAEDLLRLAGCELPEAGELRHRVSAIDGKPVRIVRESPLGVPGVSVMGDLASAEEVQRALRSAGIASGLVDLDPATADALRIEAGTPVFGRDVTPDNLPQEIARDERAINFVKGCYLGQETVARIDALGHVNKLLRGLRVAGGEHDVPPPGSEIESDGKTAGTVTSSAFSPGLGCPVALAMIRTTRAEAGTAVFVVNGESKQAAVVCDFPMNRERRLP